MPNPANNKIGKEGGEETTGQLHCHSQHGRGVARQLGAVIGCLRSTAHKHISAPSEIVLCDFSLNSILYIL